MSPKPRTEFVGASEVAALLHLHPFKTPLDIFLEKTGRAEPKKASKALDLGNMLEDGLCEYFGKHYLHANGVVLKQEQLIEGRAGATLDAVYVNGKYKNRSFKFAPIDFKVIGLSGHLPYHDAFGKGGTDEIPPHIYCQVQQQLHLLNVSSGEFDIKDGFIGLLDLQGRGTNVYRIPYAPGYGKMLMRLIDNFWFRCMKPDKAPTSTQSFMEIDF